MTYLAHVTYKVPIKILWISFSVYRQGTVLIDADSDMDAVKKMESYEKETKDVCFYSITRSL